VWDGWLGGWSNQVTQRQGFDQRSIGRAEGYRGGKGLPGIEGLGDRAEGLLLKAGVCYQGWGEGVRGD